MRAFRSVRMVFVCAQAAGARNRQPESTVKATTRLLLWLLVSTKSLLGICILVPQARCDGVRAPAIRNSPWKRAYHEARVPDHRDSLENADRCARRKAGTATNSRLWNWLAVPGLPHGKLPTVQFSPVIANFIVRNSAGAGLY